MRSERQLRLSTTVAGEPSMLRYRVAEYERLGTDLAAYELLKDAGLFAELSRKLDRLIRHHRNRVFDEHSGHAHHRAILRLKQRTVTGKAMAFDRWAGRVQREGTRLTSMGY